MVQVNHHFLDMINPKIGWLADTEWTQNQTLTGKNTNFNSFTPKSAKKLKFKKIQIAFCKILKNKWYNGTILPNRFHLNGHTIGFRLHAQKLERHIHVTITDSGSEKVRALAKNFHLEWVSD